MQNNQAVNKDAGLKSLGKESFEIKDGSQKMTKNC